MKLRSMAAMGLAGVLMMAANHTVRAQELELDPSVHELNWGSVYVLVQADTTSGVIIWASTSHVNYNGKSRNFFAGFDPELVFRWVGSAQALVDHDDHVDESSPATGLAIPLLVAADSDRIRLVRLRKGSHWDDHVSIALIAADGKESWGITATRSEAAEFLKVLFDCAVRSRLQPDAPIVVGDSTRKTLTPPVLVSSKRGPIPAYLRGVNGEVLFRFTVDTTGRVESSSIQPMLYSNHRFVKPAAEMILKAQFKPGMVDGHYARAQVVQRIVFQAR
jgi:TonB family protein